MGNESDYKIKLEDGKLIISLEYDGKGADAGLSIKLETDYLLDKLADLIPGKIDDVIIGLLKRALKD